MSLLFAYSCLPHLNLKLEPPISLRAFYEILDANLSKVDREKLNCIRRIVDIKNILSFQTGLPFDVKGNFSEANLRFALTNLEYLPDYIFDFLSENKTLAELEKNFPKLYALFFSKEIAKGGVGAEFLTFERDLNLILFGFYAKKNRINLEPFLEWEDHTNPLVEHLILQSKNSGAYIFPFEYKNLEEKILGAEADPMKQYKVINAYRFHHYMEIFETDPFSFRSICAYMMCVWILKDRSLLQEKKGREVLKEIVENGNF
jgi:hypothetical protein